MPHINRIRVNNVKYNFGTQFYDDFIMRFDGKNALYDLANGGGKSVLMLLLFQNLIPNCTLDDKQPIEKLFRTDQGSTTIHSMIEWCLDERFIRDGYKYMLTGFCARKARDEQRERETAAIDYFNYVIFYREYNANDLVNLPLTNGKERVTYSGLKSYLKDLGKKDMGLDISVFERKGDYQRFISRYGLYESQWEILKGINKTEGHVRTYFENRYKTTRKVVEDLLIEEIIQRAYQQEKDSETDMADTLVQIKDKLAELAARKEEIHNYDGQISTLEGFSGRIQSLNLVYGEKESLYQDFAKTYVTVQACHSEKEKELEQIKRDKEWSEKQLYEISKKIDTAKIQNDQEALKELERDTDAYEKELLKQKQIYQEKQKELEFLEASNEYLQLLEIQKKWETLKHYLAQDENDREGLLGQLHRLAGIKYVIHSKDQEQIEKQKYITEKALSEIQKEMVELHQKERHYFSTQAVLDNQLQELSIQSEKLAKDQYAYNQKLSRMIIGSAEDALKEEKDALSQKEKEKKDLSDAYTQLELDNARRQTENQEQKKLLERLNVENQEIDAFLMQYDIEQKKMERLCTTYQVDSMEALAEVIDTQLHHCILEYELKQQEALSIDKKIDQLMQEPPVLENKTADMVMEYLRRYHGKTCIFGGEYLKTLPEEERTLVLRDMPFLSHAIIYEGGLEKIRQDQVLRSKDFGDMTIPIVSLSQVQQQGFAIRNEDIFFLSNNLEWYWDAKKCQAMIESLKSQREKFKSRLARLLDRKKTIQEDQKYVEYFKLRYLEFYETHIQRQMRIKEEKAQCQNIIEQNEAHFAENKEKVLAYDRQLKGLEQVCLRHEQQITYMEHICQMDRELEQMDLRKKEIEKSLDICKIEKENTEEAIESRENTEKRLQQEKQSLTETLEQMARIWKESYESYYTVPCESFDASEEASIDVQFLALKEAYEKEHQDLEDKRQLLDTYQQMMDNIHISIGKKDISEYRLDVLFKDHRLLHTDQEQINACFTQQGCLKKDIEQREHHLIQYREDKNKLFGRVAHGIQNIEEKYGSFDRIESFGTTYEFYVEELKRNFNGLKIKIQDQQEQIQKAFRQLRMYEDLGHHLDRTIQNEHISMNPTMVPYPLNMDLEAKCRELEQRYFALHKKIQQNQEHFERDRQNVVEALRKLSAEALAEVIRSEISVPKSSKMALDVIQSIRETVDIIGMEKERIEKTIQDMVEIKANFEKQCIQRCISMKSELDRFSAYSKILLDGKDVPMVLLHIPYVKEEFYGQRMSEYIDAIVEKTDIYHSQEERMAYIRQQLSWKRLFSVIVTDMNRIRLSLYKRERIKEQSRYLKYEEAVGSTGQSQGIYIQFLIGVINYISMVYSMGNDASRLQKVIFIDNPFGAAKDIYIWQPIFELLKTNHVQLIVPTRGATPAITGKFDVNYILGQKMIDHVQQTVVVDYNSNIDLSSMSYETLEFEQEVLDFI